VDKKTSKYTSTKKIGFGVPLYNNGTNEKLANLTVSSVPQNVICNSQIKGVRKNDWEIRKSTFEEYLEKRSI
jgi:hypothetical protein